MIKDLSAAFSGGVAGALANGVALWLCVQTGLFEIAGISYAPSLSLPWWYPRLVWGGIFGLLFLLPVLKAKTFQRGLLFGLAPSAMMFFMVFPNSGRDYFGLSHGPLMPVLVLLVNFMWGVAGAYWHRQAR